MNILPESLPNRSTSKSDVGLLRRLLFWLSYNRYTILLYAGGIVLPMGSIILVLTLLAIVFTPFMLYVLHRNRKYGWIFSFAVLVGGPTILAFVPTGSIVLNTALHFLPLITFYLYCYVLRFSTSEWITDEGFVDEL